MPHIDGTATQFPSSAEYAEAFNAIRSKLTVNQLLMLQHHYCAPGRVTTARRLGEAVGYADHRGFNSQYGGLAKLVADHFDITVDGDAVFVLATFTSDPCTENGETLLSMRTQVAAALERVGWAPWTRAVILNATPEGTS